MDTVIIYCRATGSDWALTFDGYAWRQRHLGSFGAVLARRALDLPVDQLVEFRLL